MRFEIGMLDYYIDSVRRVMDHCKEVIPIGLAIKISNLQEVLMGLRATIGVTEGYEPSNIEWNNLAERFNLFVDYMWDKYPDMMKSLTE